MLAKPGRYLRGPSTETRRALVHTLGDGSLGVYLQTPDTLALIFRNLETFVPLFVAAQTPPFVPDEMLQAWFRTVAPRHRAEMIHALVGWLAPATDSVAHYHGVAPHFLNQRDRWRHLANVRSCAAQRLADWDAREALPGLKALRNRLGAEASRIGPDSREALESLDDAISRLEGGPCVAPLAPNGRGGFRSGFRGERILSARLLELSHRAARDVMLEPAERESLWNMVLASRETVFVGGGPNGSVDFRFDGGASAVLSLGAHWGELMLHQYPRPTQCLCHPDLYARVLSLAGSAPPPSIVKGVTSWARFRRERVVITIDRDSIQVRGQYQFLSDSAAHPFAVRFPAVRTRGDPPLRDWFASIEDPQAGAMVLPRHHAKMDSGFIIFPGVAHDTVRVVASSGDRLYGRRRVTYLLTTARAWGEPLDRAVLEVDWPDSLGAPQFSLPLVRAAHSRGRTRYRYEAAPFQPDTDLVVRW